MALELSIDLCLRSNCTELIFKELTGAYSESNTTGYGQINPTAQSALTAVLTVTNPEGTVYTINLLSTGYFPTGDEDFEYTIPLSQLGNVSSIMDGYWTFTYTVTFPGSRSEDNTYTVTIARTFTCAINCCIQNMKNKLKLTKCDSCDNYFTYEDYVKTVALRDSIVNATECGDTQYIEDILEVLQKICNKSRCKTCN